MLAWPAPSNPISRSSNGSMVHSAFSGTKKAAKKAFGKSGRNSWKQLVDTTQSFETDKFRLAHAVVLLLSVALLIGIHFATTSAGVLLWFIPAWVLFLGLERLLHRRHKEQRSWAWLFNSWLSHWELLLHVSIVTSYAIYPRRRSELGLGVMASVAVQAALSLWSLVCVSLVPQLGLLLLLAGVQSLALGLGIAGTHTSWALGELGVTGTLVVTTGLLMLTVLRNRQL